MTIAPDGGTLVPRTQEELDMLIQLKPDYWEYRLFAGALILEISAMDTRYEDYLLGYAPRRGVAIYDPEFVNFLKMQASELRIIAGSFTRLFNDETSARAFNPPGVAGNVGRILHLAKRYIGIYDELLLWTERLRGTSVPSKYHDLLSILARYSDQPIQEIRRFVAAYAEKVESIPYLVEAADELPIVITHKVKWSIPRQLVDGYNAEIDRLKAVR